MQTTQKIFRNRNFVKRNYECSNIVYCIAEEAPKTSDDRWQPADGMPGTMDFIYSENGVRFYGWL